MSDTSLAVSAEGLIKRYGTTTALDHFDLAVREATVCGLLGPNGAGKTTAVRILSTLLRPDGGRARVADHDVVKDGAKVRFRIGLVGQQTTVDDLLTGRENLVMWGRLFHLDKRTARRRADEMLELFGLTDAANRSAKKYSGGMRRRLDLAASLLLAPKVLFLDEPTTGLDPRNRNEVWSYLRNLVKAGTTVVLTTQYLDEADQLADQIAVIDHGRVIADDTPDRLKARIGGDQIDVVVQDAAEIAKATAVVADVAEGEVEVDVDTRRISAGVRDRMAALADVVRRLSDAGIAVEDIALRRPTLDEVFLRLTGHRAESDADSDTNSGPNSGTNKEVAV